MPKDPIDEVVVFPGVILSGQLVMGVPQVNVGASEVRQSMSELRAVGGPDWASVGGDVIGVVPNTPLHDCWYPPGFDPVQLPGGRAQ